MTRKQTPRPLQPRAARPTGPDRPGKPTGTLAVAEWPEFPRIYAFLLETLNAADLHALPRLALPPSSAAVIAAALPSGNPTTSELVDALLQAMQRNHKTPPPSFWEHLHRIREDRRDEIEALRRPFGATSPGSRSAPRSLSRRQPPAASSAAQLAPCEDQRSTRLCLAAPAFGDLDLLSGLGGDLHHRTALARHFAELKPRAVNGADRRLLLSWTAERLQVNAWPALRIGARDIVSPFSVPLPLAGTLQFQYFPCGSRWLEPPEFAPVVYELRIVCWSGRLRRFDLSTSTHELCVEL